MKIRQMTGAALLLLAIGAPAAHAAGVAAGTAITNTATATFDDPDGNPVTVNSNPSVVTVDELLDVVVARNDAGNVLVDAGVTDVPLSFTVTNTGNGPENMRLAFDASLGGDQFDPTNVRIYLDNGDGIFDPMVDTLYVPTINDPLIDADDSRIVFVVADMPGVLNNGDLGNVNFSAEAVTSITTLGPDAPGTTFAGAGVGGTDAVVGASGAYADIVHGYYVSSVQTTFTKTQSVADPYGGNSPVPGAIITYTLTFDVIGTGSITNALITDPLPANTTYVPGSLRLDASVLTDPIDADIGSFRDLGGVMGVHVNLGTVNAPVTHVVTFDVRIDCQTAPGTGNQCNPY